MADDYIVQHQDLQPDPYLTMVRGMYMRMGFGPLPDPTEDNTSGEVAARINHGRWLVDCGGCNSALVVDLAQPVFMCVECANAANDGKWFKVTVPSNRKAIEAELQAEQQRQAAQVQEFHQPRGEKRTAGEK